MCFSVCEKMYDIICLLYSYTYWYTPRVKNYRFLWKRKVKTLEIKKVHVCIWPALFFEAVRSWLVGWVVKIERKVGRLLAVVEASTEKCFYRKGKWENLCFRLKYTCIPYECMQMYKNKRKGGNSHYNNTTACLTEKGNKFRGTDPARLFRKNTRMNEWRIGL